MGIWDKEREAFAERQRQKAAKLQAILKEREQKVQHFIDDFLIPKFKELIKNFPDSETLNISFRYDGGDTSYYTCTPPGISLSSPKTTETEIAFDGTTLSDAVRIIKDNYEFYRLICDETNIVGRCEYSFNLFLAL